MIIMELITDLVTSIKKNIIDVEEDAATVNYQFQDDINYQFQDDSNYEF